MPKNVVITGVSSGIGRAAAQDLVGRGWRVFGSVRQDRDGAALRAALGENFVPLVFDVTDAQAVAAAATAVKQALGAEPLAGLVNNAGIAVAGPLLYVTPEDFRRQIVTNLVGPFLTTRAFAPLLIGHPPGRVVTITSVAGTNALPFNGPYSAAKFGLEGFCASLRRELAVFGVKAIVIAPGPVRSAIWEKTAALDLSPLAGTPYEAAGAKMLAMMAQAAAAALPAERLAALIFKALTTPRPQARYLFTGSRLSYGALKYLPTWLTDRLIARAVGLWPATR